MRLVLVLYFFLSSLATLAQQTVFFKTLGSNYGDSTGKIKKNSKSEVFFSTSYNDTFFLDTINYIKAPFRNASIVKIDTNNNIVQFADFEQSSGTYISPPIFDIDKNDDFYGGFNFIGTIDMIPGPITYNVSSQKNFPVFFKMDSSKNVFWVNQLEGNRDAVLIDIATSDSSIVIIGAYHDTIWPINFSNNKLISKSSYFDVFILKYKLNGTFCWLKSLKGDKTDYGGNVIIDNTNESIYISGYHTDSIDLNPNDSIVYMSKYKSGSYVLNLDRNGNYKWVLDLPYAVSPSLFLNSQKEIVINGAINTQSFNFDIQGGTYIVNFPSGTNRFIAKYDNLSKLKWAKQITTSGYFIDDSLDFALINPTSLNKYDTLGNIYKSLNLNNHFNSHSVVVNDSLIYVAGIFSNNTSYYNNPCFPVYYAKGSTDIQLIKLNLNKFHAEKPDFTPSLVTLCRGDSIMLINSKPLNDATHWGWKGNLNSFSSGDTVVLKPYWTNQYTIEGKGNCLPSGPSSSVVINISICTSIEESHATFYKVYPNPTKSEVFVEGVDLMGKDWILYNIYGEKVKEGYFKSNYSTINLSDLQNSIYILKNGMNTERIIKN